MDKSLKIEYPYPCCICGVLCESEESSDFYSTYWSALRIPICKIHSPIECREYQKQEAYECQLIDSDCNDCKHFKRGSRNLYRGDKVKTQDGEYNRILVAHDVFCGRCQKFDKPTIAFVNMATGHECFEHRRLLHVEA